MQPSSTLCRAQEARQLALASSSSLDNVRRVANAAAAAWGKEGKIAEQREGRKLRNREALDLATKAEQDEDRAFSENPDRGYAEATLVEEAA
jgi:hypothetical protein